MGRGAPVAKGAGLSMFAAVLIILGGFIGNHREPGSLSSIATGAGIGFLVYFFIVMFFVWTGLWGLLALLAVYLIHQHRKSSKAHD